MNILYIGDIYGEPGIRIVTNLLPDLIKENKIDLVIAQAENVSDGRSLLPKDRQRLQQIGVDFFSGGNWSLFREEAHADLDNENIPVIRPANYPEGTPGKGYKYITKNGKKVLVISLLGHIVGRDSDKPMENPLVLIDKILEYNKGIKRDATVVNLHGDYSSEKVVIGFYLDGKVTAVVGDHWHVPTADALVLPKGTAHITDVGMCGTLFSSLGVTTKIIIDRWHDNIVNRNEVASGGPLQFNTVLIQSDDTTGLAKSIKPIRKVI